MEIRKEKKALDKLYRRRDRYDLQPDFQREEVWSEPRQQKLMDTILKKWDIPKVYIRVIDEENFQCVDGQQRMNSIFKFYDSKLKLPKESKKYAGRFYNDLPDTIKDNFDDYELDLALIYDASDEELRELFARLQLGMPLNSAEKLNAMTGDMRDFVKKLSEHKFFTNIVPLKDNRYAFQAMSAQICLLEIDGIRNVKFEDLSEFYKQKQNFNFQSQKAKKILKTISEIDNIFVAKTSAFRNRASIISFYVLLSELIDGGLKINDDIKGKLKDFYIKFQHSLKDEIEKGANAEDTELVVYQSKVNQAADSKDSILRRHQILRRRLVNFDSSFKKFLKLENKEEELAELQKKDNIKKLIDDSIELISEINKIYSAKNNGVDLFKMTTEFLKCIKTVGTPISKKEDFKKVIDALYKSIYESSGSLARIPTNLIKEDSVFVEIKHIRTDLFHDVEHGKQKDIKKKKKIISSIYSKYTKKKAFDEIDESTLVYFQKRLLEEVKSSLKKVKERIK